MSFTSLSERQDPRLLRALDVVAPGGALREGIDNIVHARTGGLIVVGDPGDISHLLSGGIELDIDYTPAMLYQVAKMDGAIVLNAEATKIVWANVQLMPDPTILSSETGHPPPHRRARLQTDRGAGDRDLPAPRRRLALRRGHQVHPPGHPRRAGQGQPGPGDAGEVPRAARPGLDPAHRARVRGRRRPLRRPLRPAAGRAGDADGGRGRALHRRARHRGPADRDAARGDDGRRRRRQDGADPRLLAWRTPSRTWRRCCSRCHGCRTRTCSTSVASASCSATTASSTRSTSRWRRAATACWAASPAFPSLSSRRSSSELGGLEEVLAASDADLEAVDDVGPTRAKDIREGLRRLQEVDLVDRYLQS